MAQYFKCIPVVAEGVASWYKWFKWYMIKRKIDFRGWTGQASYDLWWFSTPHRFRVLYHSSSQFIIDLYFWTQFTRFHHISEFVIRPSGNHSGSGPLERHRLDVVVWLSTERALFNGGRKQRVWGGVKIIHMYIYIIYIYIYIYIYVHDAIDIVILIWERTCIYIYIDMQKTTKTIYI